MKVSLSLLVLNIIDNQLCVLIQKRLNKNEPEWINTWEVPQGKISEDKSFLSTARDELRDETGLELKAIHLSENCDGLFNLSGSITYLEPFMTVNLSKPYKHQSIHVLAIAEGNTHNTEEAVDHRWVPLSKLTPILLGESVCPLNRSALEKLSKTSEKKLYRFVKNEKNKVCRVEINQAIVSFDIGGILILWNDQTLFSSLAKIFCCSFEKIDYLISGNLRHELHLGNISHLNLWEKLCNSLSSRPSFDDFLAAWAASVKPINENIEIVKRFRGRFSDLCIIATTNIDAVTENVLFENYEWSNVFNHWFSSWRLGSSKPKRKFFQIVTDSLQSPKNNIFLIDDREKNIISAKEYGWKTFQHNFNEIIDERRLNREVSEWLMKI